MGNSAAKNFECRFGNPPRITVKFVDSELDSDRIFGAWRGCVEAMLGRAPTESELLGQVSLEEVIKKEQAKGAYYGYAD